MPDIILVNTNSSGDNFDPTPYPVQGGAAPGSLISFQATSDSPITVNVDPLLFGVSSFIVTRSGTTLTVAKDAPERSYTLSVNPTGHTREHEQGHAHEHEQAHGHARRPLVGHGNNGSIKVGGGTEDDDGDD